jgi:maltose alpha-D-glucosyltransferase/alpha-amylase
VLPAGREVAPNGALLRLGKRQLAQLEKEALPAFLRPRRWFAAKGEKVEKIEISEIVEMDNRVLALLGVHLAGDDGTEPQLYALPLAATWEDKEDVYGPLAPYAVAKLRRRARVGVLHDAVADDEFCRYLLRAMGEEERVSTDRGEIRFTKTSVFEELVGEDGVDGLSVRRSGVEQSNTSIVFGERLVVKLYRRLRRGINPELEVGRFLTEVARFEHTPPLAGAVEYHGPSGETTLAILQGFVPNQGDGWSYVLDRLALYLEDQLISPWTPDEDVDEEEKETDAFFLGLMRTLGYRTGELHKAFATPTDDPAFSPEPVGVDEFRGWTENIRREAEETLDALRTRQPGLPEGLQVEVDELLGRREELMDRLSEISGLDVETVKTRHHGDYHLGQVLVANNDFQIIDFEGEPGRAILERRAKHSPMRDVAGMLRSFNYAAYAAFHNVSIERLDHRRDDMERWVRQWEEGTREAFLEGYQGGAAGGSSYPEDPEHARALIELFTLEKALYEVRYELDNRPDWLAIPVRGILDLLSGNQTGDSAAGTETQKKEEV